MAFDLIRAYEEDITRLSAAIEERERLLEQDNLGDEGLKKLSEDLFNRYMSNFNLKKLKECKLMRLEHDFTLTLTSPI